MRCQPIHISAVPCNGVGLRSLTMTAITGIRANKRKQDKMGKNCMLWSVVAALCAGSGANAFAQSYPDKPIRIVVPSAPGGPTDLPARLASQILPPRLGQPVVVENRPGAAGAIGARSVATAPPDGYLLLAGSTSVFAVLPSVSSSAGYDPIQNFAPVAKVSESYQILVVHPSSPWKSVKAFLLVLRCLTSERQSPSFVRSRQGVRSPD